MLKIIFSGARTGKKDRMIRKEKSAQSSAPFAEIFQLMKHFHTFPCLLKSSVSKLLPNCQCWMNTGVIQETKICYYLFYFKLTKGSGMNFKTWAESKIPYVICRYGNQFRKPPYEILLFAQFVIRFTSETWLKFSRCLRAKLLSFSVSLCHVWFSKNK